MRRIYRVDPAGEPHPLAVHDVASALRHGELALLPTETVYGVGVAVNAFAGSSVAAGSAPATDPASAALPAPGTGYRRIFTLKHRDLAQTVPWLVAGEDDLDRYSVDVPPAAHALARAFWPGALTLVVCAARTVPPFMQAADGTVALRASASPVIQALVRTARSPLAVTSANTHGKSAPASFAAVESRVLTGVDVAVDAGETPCCDASTIVSLTGPAPRLLRQGALPAARVDEALAAAGCPPLSASGPR